MKSAGNRGVVQSRLQVLHVHVFLAAPLGARHVAEPGADQYQGGVAIGECPHHTGAPTGLAALIARRLRQGLRLLFQQLVRGFLYTSSN